VCVCSWQKVPFPWFALFDKLQSLKTTTMTFEEVVEIAGTCGLPALQGNSLHDDVRQFLSYFAEIGAWKYLSEFKLVILSPCEFFIGPITKVIRDFDIHRTDGPEYNLARL
jgi:hypothetical protein